MPRKEPGPSKWEYVGIKNRDSKSGSKARPRAAGKPIAIVVTDADKKKYAAVIE